MNYTQNYSLININGKVYIERPGNHDPDVRDRKRLMNMIRAEQHALEPGKIEFNRKFIEYSNIEKSKF